MEDNIKVNVQTNNMIAIQQGGFYCEDSSSKDAWIHTKLGIDKTQSYAAKTREILN